MDQFSSMYRRTGEAASVATRRAALCVGMVALVWIFAGASAQAGALGGPRCNTMAASDCITTQCWVSCSGTDNDNEMELREAVDAANDCNNITAFSRIIWINHTGECTIRLENDDVGAPATCPDLAAQGEFYDRAICLKGHHITIYGGSSSTTFEYIGPFPTGSPTKCDPMANKGGGPPAFVLRGHHNALFWFQTKFFPEGIDIRSGYGHHLEAVHSDYFCDEAITVNEGATGSGSESGALVTLSTFRGRTQHANCVNQLCGTDKAIQILGLGSKAEIRRNTFIYTRAPVEALGGTHMILDNVIKGFEKDAACGAPFHCGDAVSNPDKYCENLEFSTSDITLKNNVMAYEVYPILRQFPVRNSLVSSGLSEGAVVVPSPSRFSFRPALLVLLLLPSPGCGVARPAL